MAARWPNLAPRWDWPKMANLSRKSERGGVGPVAAGATGNGRKTPLGQELERIWKGFGKGFDTRFKHARPPLRGGGGSKTPAASTAGPFLSSLAFSEPALEVHGERSKLEAKIQQTLAQEAGKIEPESLKIEAWRGSGSSWGRPWDENCPGGCLGRFWAILDRRGMPKMAARWPNLAPKWGQDGTKKAQDGACLTILRPLGEPSWPFWRSWGRSLQKWPKCKNEYHYGVLATFSGLGRSGWRLLGLFWRILARSWAILGDLGVKLGPCWQHDGIKMAKMSQDRRT